MAALRSRVEACVPYLKGNRDEDKFAGLLLVAQVLRQADSSGETALDRELASLVLNGVGVSFLQRLLRTQTAQTDPKTPFSPYQTLCVHLLAVFCRSGLVVELGGLLPDLLQLVTTLFKDRDKETPLPADVNVLLDDWLQILYLHAQGFVTASSHQDTDATTVARMRTHLLLQQTSRVLPSLPAVFQKRALDVVQLCLQALAVSGCAGLRECWHTSVPPLARQFALDQTSLKFDLLPLLLHFLALAHTHSDHHGACADIFPPDLPLWSLHLRLGLGELLSSRVTPLHTRTALIASQLLLQHLGALWASYPLRRAQQLEAGSKPEESAPCTDFLKVLFSAVAVEVSVFLEVDSHCTAEEEEKKIGVSGVDSLVASLTLTELGLRHLLASREDCLSGRQRDLEFSAQCVWSALHIDVGMLVSRRLQQVVGSALKYLKQSEPEAGAFTQCPSRDPVLFACVRVIGAWLAEEPHSMTAEVEEVFPYLLSLCVPRQLPCIPPALHFLVPALPFLVTNAKLRAHMVQAETVKHVLSVLQALPLDGSKHCMTLSEFTPLCAFLLAFLEARSREHTPSPLEFEAFLRPLLHSAQVLATQTLQKSSSDTRVALCILSSILFHLTALSRVEVPTGEATTLRLLLKAMTALIALDDGTAVLSIHVIWDRAVKTLTKCVPTAEAKSRTLHPLARAVTSNLDGFCTEVLRVLMCSPQQRLSEETLCMYDCLLAAVVQAPPEAGLTRLRNHILGSVETMRQQNVHLPLPKVQALLSQ